jgi:hypothetical protein
VKINRLNQSGNQSTSGHATCQGVQTLVAKAKLFNTKNRTAIFVKQYVPIFLK